MAFEALTSIPCEFESGNSVTITMPLPDVLPSEGAATLYLSLNGGTPVTVNASEGTNDFTFTISKTTTAAMTPGVWDWVIYFTYTAGERVQPSGCTGQVRVTPNLAVAQTPSTAQAQVTLLESLFTTLNASDKASVSFNGQSFTRANRNELLDQYRFWKARLIAEQRAAARARGGGPTGVYAPHFSGGVSNPYCNC